MFVRCLHARTFEKITQQEESFERSLILQNVLIVHDAQVYFFLSYPELIGYQEETAHLIHKTYNQKHKKDRKSVV